MLNGSGEANKARRRRQSAHVLAHRALIDRSGKSARSSATGYLVITEVSHLYFGPKAPAGKEANWIASVPGKGWFAIFRLYGPLEPWFNKTWRPGEIEEVK